MNKRRRFKAKRRRAELASLAALRVATYSWWQNQSPTSTAWLDGDGMDAALRAAFNACHRGVVL